MLGNAPRGLEVTRRVKGASNYTFLLNHAATPVSVPVGAGYTDLVTGQAAPSTVELRPYAYVVLKK